MADNLVLKNDDTTVQGTVRTDDVGGVHVPASKIVLGPDGVDAGFVSAGNPLPVGDAGGSLTVDGSVSLAGALPAGTNLIGRTAASPDSDVVYQGATALAPKFAAISAGSAGANTLVAAVPGKRIRVLGVVLVCAGSVALKFQSGTATDLTGAMAMSANGGFAPPASPFGQFQTTAGEALVLHLSAASAVGGWLSYVEAA